MEEERTSILEQEVAKLRAEGVETCALLSQLLTAMNQQQQSQEPPKPIPQK
jgi:hypothetical protein